MKYPACWMPDAAMPCGAPPNVAGPMPPPERPGRRARARAKAQAEGLNAKTVQDELTTSCKLTLPAKRLERGDIRRAVEVALREWPQKSQAEIAAQVGCSQVYVGKVKDNITVILPPTRTDSMGRTRPTSYATKTPTSATGTGLDIRPDIRRTGDRPGHDARGLPEHP